MTMASSYWFVFHIAVFLLVLQPDFSAQADNAHRSSVVMDINSKYGTFFSTSTREKLNGLALRMSTVLKSTKNHISSLGNSSLKDYVDFFEVLSKEINSIDSTCRYNAVIQLSNVRNSFIMDILNCPKNQEMVTDIEKMVYALRNILVGIATNVRLMLDELHNCMTINPLKIGACITEELILSGEATVEAVISTLEFTLTTAENTEDIVATTVWCIRNATDSSMARVGDVLTAARNCNHQ